jgi:hypothetical protein
MYPSDLSISCISSSPLALAKKRALLTGEGLELGGEVIDVSASGGRSMTSSIAGRK